MGNRERLALILHEADTMDFDDWDELSELAQSRYLREADHLLNHPELIVEFRTYGIRGE